MSNDKFMKIIEEQRNESKRWQDLIVPVKEIKVQAWDEEKKVSERGKVINKIEQHNELFVGERVYPYSDYAFSQFLRKLEIAPKTYSKLTCDVREKVVRDRIEQLEADDSYKLRIRTVNDGEEKIAGVVSPRYVAIEDFDILTGLIPLAEAGTIEIESYDRGHWLNPFSTSNYRFTIPSTKTDVVGSSVNDVLSVGFHLSNSRIGAKSLTINKLIWRLVCTNGLILPSKENIVRQRHIHFEKEMFLNNLNVEIEVFMKSSQKFLNRMAETKNVWLGVSATDSFQAAFNRLSGYVPRFIADRALDIYRSQSDWTMYGLTNCFTQAARDTDTPAADSVAKRLDIESAIGAAIFS